MAEKKSLVGLIACFLISEVSNKAVNHEMLCFFALIVCGIICFPLDFKISAVKSLQLTITIAFFYYKEKA